MPLTRPRRPDPNTLSYLQQLPADSVDAAIAALQEIGRQELASLAGDEQGAQCLEHLLRTAPPGEAIAALDACRSYGMHLATHRYGSHVLQTILQRVTEAMGGGDNNNNTRAHVVVTPILTDLVSELDVMDLVYHMCGSHVVRSLIACCGGVLEVNSQSSLPRGKVKKKKKKNNPDAATERRLNTVTLTKPDKSRGATKEMRQLLYSISDTLLEGFDATDWPYHASSSAVVGVILKVLSLQEDDTRSRQAVQQWIEALDLPTHWKDFVNDTSASRLLEAAAESCSDNDAFVKLFVEPVLEHMTDLLANDNAAHVVQTVVQQLRTPKQFDDIWAKMGDLSVVVQQRRHVLLGLVQAAQTEQQQQSLVHHVRKQLDTVLQCRQSTYLVDATGAQVLHHMVTQYPARIIQQPLLLDHVIPELLIDTTEYWCDSVASRWIVEPLCENTVYAGLLEKKARGILPTVAQHRVGRHVVTKLNAQLPTKRQYAVADIQKKVRKQFGGPNVKVDEGNNMDAMQPRNKKKRTLAEATTD